MDHCTQGRSHAVLGDRRPRAIAPVMLALSVLTACGDDQTGPAEPMEIVPDTATLTHVGERIAFAVRGGGAGGAAWRSADTAVFVVDGSGAVTARGNGAARLTASRAGMQAHALVQVRQVAAALEAVGDEQSAAPGLSLPEPFGVRAVDAGGAGVAGVRIRFEPESGSGRTDPESARTDSRGLVFAVWTLGPATGRQRLRAVSEDGSLSTEVWAGVVDPNDVVAAIEPFSGEDQWELRGQALSEPVGARVLDDAGRPVWGATVRFEADEASGRVSPSLALSDSSGVASAVWTLGGDLGAQRLAAVFGELTAAFEATAVSDEGVCNRTPQVSAEIARLAGVGSCAEVTDEALARIFGLMNLDDRGIRRIRGGDFDGLAAVQHLNLDGNELATLPPRVFEGLVAVKGLGLGGNKLAALPSGAFEGLPALEQLNLGWNELAALAPSIFAGLPALQRLDLGWNELAALPPGVLDGLPALSELYLERNELAALPPGVFDGLPALRRLWLQSNSLAALPPGVFDGLSRLWNLNLTANSLTRLAPGTFSGLSDLEVLWLGHNPLNEVPEDIFRGLSSLRSLSLNNNQLTSLPEGVFAGLSLLKDLALDGNRLAALPPGLFAEMPALERIFLEENVVLRELPAGLFAGTPALRRLNLRDNSLRKLRDGIFDGLPNLAWLNLESNGLGKLPLGVFDETPELAELNLRSNTLKELPRGVFAGLSGLRYVNVSGNLGAPFPVRPELVREDDGDPLAPGPARVVVRVPMGAPAALDFPVSAQTGTSSSWRSVSLAAGDTASAPFVVSGGEQGAPVHVAFGPAPEITGVGYGGLEPVRGEELVLFGASDNRTPVARSRIWPHRMQAGGQAARLELGDLFEDPDGDSLSLAAATTVPGVVDARIEGEVLWLEPLSADTTQVEVTAKDPGGLRATHRFLTWVVPESDPDAFNIELYFEPGFTPEEQATVRRAADRWMEVVTGDLPDVPVDEDGYCVDDPGRRLRVVGAVDDLLVFFKMHPSLGRRAVGRALVCGQRAEGEHVFVGQSSIAEWWVRGRDPRYLYNTALHEIGHLLGLVGGWPMRDGADTHFAGPLAVAAFDAAGGADYRGAKVPAEGGGHWRRSVIPDDIMAPGTGQIVTAITVQALADLGHEVDVTRADPYTLPISAMGDAATGFRAEEGVEPEEPICEVVRGPFVVVDTDGRVVRVVRP